jgi:hypothetical protein
MFATFRIYPFIVYLATSAIFLPSVASAVGSTPVTVVNPVDIAKAQGIQKPFETSIQCSADSFGIRCFGSVNVPTDQRWVIEYVSASCLIDNTKQVLSQVGVQISSFHYLEISDHVGARGDSGTAINVVQLGQTVRLYASPGSQIGVFAGTSGISSFSGYPNCNFSLSGQSISVP